MIEPSDYTIKTNNNICPSGWDDFVLTANGGSFFSFSGYYKILKADIFYITAYDNMNNIVGGIIGRVRGSGFPANLVAKSIWVESGILTKLNDLVESDKLKKSMLQILEDEARFRNCISIRFNHWCREDNSKVFFSSGFKYLPNCTFICDLTDSEHELFSAMTKGHKSTIKKALKNNLTIKITDKNENDELDKFYSLYKLTQERAVTSNANTSMTLRSKMFLEGILNAKNLPCYLICVYADKLLAASGIFVERHDTVYYFIGASDIELNREYGASNLLIWRSMLLAKEKGIKYFDFGGVPNEPMPDDPAYGVYHFKRNFGGKLATYFTGQKILSPVRSNIFDTLMQNRSLIRLAFKIGRKYGYNSIFP
jgi:hypothetical protein